MIDRKLQRRHPTFSPFDPIFAHYEPSLPWAVREQFCVSPDEPFEVVLEGTMHRVGHRPKWLSPIMGLAHRAGILVPYRGRDVPTTVRIHARRYPTGSPYHTYERTFRFPGRPVRFFTTTLYDPALDRVADRVGPGGSIYIVWDARFHPPATCTQDTEAIALHLGGRKLWLPRPVWQWLFGAVHHIQYVDPEHDDTIHVGLVIRHPLLGYFFGYRGTFRLTRAPRS
jgi:hypothetical protein